MNAYITIGLPGSGKSTWAKEFIEASKEFDVFIARINNDDIRELIYYDKGDRTWSPDVEKIVKIRREDAITAYASKNIDVVVDNTHLNNKTLNQIISFCESKGYKVQTVDFSHVSLETCIERDKQRIGTNGHVGEKVIRDMYNKFMKEPVDRELPSWEPNSLPDCIIVDIDGTLAKMKDRGPFDENKVYQDEVRKHVLFTIMSLLIANPELKIFIFSGRSTACEDETIRWIQDKCGLGVSNNLNLDETKDYDYEVELHMRVEGDRRRDSLVKRDLYNLYVKDKYNVIVVFDDRPQVIRECWKDLNLPVFNCGLIDVEF